MALSTEPVSQAPEDLTRDGSLLKSVLVEGSGEPAGRGSKVAVRYALRLSDEEGAEPFDSSAKRRDGMLEFTLGRKKVVPALELVAQSMKLGEKCKARAAAPYAFGARGLKRKGVPPNAVVFMDVELVRCEGGEKKKSLADMCPAERFEEAKSCKEVGNNFFKEQKYEKALAQYSQSIRFLSNVFYKPSSTLADPAATPVGEKVTEGKQMSEEGVNNADNGEGFQEAEVIEKKSNGELNPNNHKEAQEEGDTASQQAPPVTGEGGDPAHQGRTSIHEGQTSTGSSGTVQAKDEEVIETIDVSTTSDKTLQAELKAAKQGDDLDSAYRQSASKLDAEEDAGISDRTQAIPASEGDSAPTSDDPEESEVRALHVTTLNNLSLCFVKLEDYKRAVDSAALALQIDPESSKALYYRYDLRDVTKFYFSS